jgi:hypothetical protein
MAIEQRFHGSVVSHSMVIDSLLTKEEDEEEEKTNSLPNPTLFAFMPGATRLTTQNHGHVRVARIASLRSNPTRSQMRLEIWFPGSKLVQTDEDFAKAVGSRRVRSGVRHGAEPDHPCCRSLLLELAELADEGVDRTEHGVKRV